MNKDAILATIIGFVIGLCITGLILLGPRMTHILPRFSIKLPAISFTKPKPTPGAQPKSKAFDVTVESPAHDTIVADTSLVVSGSTAPGATVVLQGNVDDAVIIASKDGKYAGKLTLIEGENTISVTGYTSSERKTKTITVFYTQETL